jgi:hypothetical protein
MRYFYRIAHFDDGEKSSSFDKITELTKLLDTTENKHAQSVLISGICDLQKIDNYYRTKRIKNIPKEFLYGGGSDIRTWTHTNEFREITKENYESIVELEKEILSREMIKKAGLKHWHYPIKTDREDIEEFFKELLIEEFLEKNKDLFVPKITQSSSLNW